MRLQSALPALLLAACVLAALAGPAQAGLCSCACCGSNSTCTPASVGAFSNDCGLCDDSACRDAFPAACFQRPFSEVQRATCNVFSGNATCACFCQCSGGACKGSSFQGTLPLGTPDACGRCSVALCAQNYPDTCMVRAVPGFVDVQASCAPDGSDGTSVSRTRTTSVSQTTTSAAAITELPSGPSASPPAQTTSRPASAGSTSANVAALGLAVVFGALAL